jgi:tRNA-specific 2-thiouridylase
MGKMKKIALGLSGGVDSAVSLVLLLEQGYEVTAVFLECWRAPGCRAEEDRKDALAVALDAGVPFKVLDFKDAYRQRVVESFFADLEKGLTPNPDVWCNTEIKFGLFYDWAMQNGFDAIATGHYAQVVEGKLARSADEKKDQTYFLYRTESEKLRHVLFPIGHLTKVKVRAEAEKRNLLVAKKADSQGICFIGDINVDEFVQEHLGEKPGEVLDVDGNVIGSHRGVWFYTIGQRHGFTLLPKVRLQNAEWKHVLPPLYVIEKNAEANTITVGYGVETTRSSISLTEVVWREESVPTRCFARVRHGGALLPIELKLDRENQAAELIFDTPQRGLAAGQSVVLYVGEQGKVCAGGGVIVAQ